jgi:nucleotide-binding universal stress UspA family protein
MSHPIFHRIVVPTDFSECAEGAWALARRMAAALGSELVLVHVLVDAPHYADGTVQHRTHARRVRGRPDLG